MAIYSSTSSGAAAEETSRASLLPEISLSSDTPLISPLGDLRVVPLEFLILHEAHDQNRLDSLRARIEKEDVQRNPVIASPHHDRYLVLDGVHRIHTLRELGCQLILLQLVDPPERAESWAHLIRNVDTKGVLDHLEEIEVSEKPDGEWLAMVETGEGMRQFVRVREGGLVEEVRAMWELQSLYPEDEPVRRIAPDSRFTLSNGETLIHYRSFTPEDLAEIVRAGEVLPAGITRFQVKERVLGVRFPLEKLKDGEPQARNAELEEMVRVLWEANRIRHYDEPVVLFE